MSNDSLAAPLRQSLYQASLRLFLRIVFKIFYGYRATGQENLPAQGGLILAPNHASYLDPILVAIGQNRPLRFMAWSAIFKPRLFGALIRSVGAFPVNVNELDAAAYRTALTALKRGEWLVIFPEGKRTEDGRLLPLKPGVAHLALRVGVPIIPVRIEGSYKAWPKGQKLPGIFRRCTVRYGQPIGINELLKINKAEREQLAEKLLAQLKDALAENTPSH